tara:strand:- start:5344 stop:5481 length:138 start_codon:yes stop_codon:yes gene_type:complete
MNPLIIVAVFLALISVAGLAKKTESYSCRPLKLLAPPLGLEPRTL